MNWILAAAVLVAIYLAAARYIHSRGIWGDRITFYGPIMAIRTTRVDLLDRFQRFSRFFRIYGTIGIGVVVLVSVLITVMLLVSVGATLIMQPEPTGIYEPRNILLIPGINQFIPSTAAVWLAFVLTIAIHEFGHGILCRVEGFRVKAMGVLLAVIPIGFFVEPDEDEVEAARTLPKIRMYGAGITNNIVAGGVCLVVLLLLLGMAIPLPVPFIAGVYDGSPAARANVPPDSLILEINGIPVDTRDEVTAIMSTTSPGDRVSLLLKTDSETQSATVTLGHWPESFTDHPDAGFMGIYYYDAPMVRETFGRLATPLGLLQLLILPFDTSVSGQLLGVIAFDSDALVAWAEPFAGYWELVHLFFWCGWISTNVGIFNALPMVPLDGGLILREGATRLLDRAGLARYAPHVVGSISWIVLFMLISLIALPYLLRF
ncbi:MAG: site-2 protease family protein [Methanomicrobiales archaeon]